MSEKGHFRPIGSNGFYRRGGTRANFDQQPIEAQATVSACLEAYRATSDVWWYEQAQRAFDWFIGWNDLGLGTLLSRDRRLPRWFARGSGQREPGSGIHPGLPAFAGGNALGAKHPDQFQGTDRHRRSSRQLPCPFTSNAPPRSSIPTSRAFFCGPSVREIPQRIARIVARIMALPEDQVGPLLDGSLRRILPAAPADPQALPGAL